MDSGIAPASLAAGVISVKRWSLLFRAVARFSRRNPLGAVGAAIMVLLVMMGTIGPFVAPYDPTELAVVEKFAKPAWGTHLLGGDRLGRDVLSRLLHGAWISLLVGIVASASGTFAGAIMGLVSGYMGGKTDALIQRIVDMLMAFPLIILAMALLSGLDRSVNTITAAIAVPMIPYGARLVRSTTLVIKESQYVEAAKSVGCSDLRIIFRHIAPGCIAPYIVVATSLVGVAIIAESALGFLGLSIAPPTPTWGAMLSKAVGGQFSTITTAPHLAIVPGVAISLAVFAFNVVGDSLRDELDPRLRGRT